MYSVNSFLNAGEQARHLTPRLFLLVGILSGLVGVFGRRINRTLVHTDSHLAVYLAKCVKYHKKRFYVVDKSEKKYMARNDRAVSRDYH